MFTEKQKQLISIFKHNQLKRINLLEGSVRSGKTWISLVLWALWVASMPKDGEYLMVAKTLTSLSRNCLNLLESLVGSKNFTYSTSKKEGRLFGRLIYLEGVNDARAESKIRGMTLTGAYCDEATLFTEDFFTMLLSRLSVRGAKLFATTNPDSPKHWLMVKYIERQEELDMFVMKFLIDDNTFLDPEYIKQLKIEYTGVFYDRFILGLWKIAEGLIYDMFNDKTHVIDEVPEKLTGERYVSCDYGTQNATVFLLWEKGVGGKWYCTKEYYYSGRTKQKQKTDEEYCDDLIEFLDGKRITAFVVDPSAASFIAALKKRGIRVKRAKNDVLNGIRETGTALKTGRIYFMRECKDTIGEFYGYSWDPKAAEHGEDKPIKAEDHGMDALRYMVYTVICEKGRMKTMDKSILGI